MAWTVTISLDKDKDDVGSAVATWNSGQADQFTYHARLQATGASAIAFADEAKAELAEHLAKRAQEAVYVPVLEAILNGE